MNGLHTASGIDRHIHEPALILGFAALSLYTSEDLALLCLETGSVALSASRLVVPRRLEDRIHYGQSHD
ncbi:hypothetical protein RBA06_21840, partial [Mycobacteroides abscessus subsp. abscessus]